jgi:pilus assembly protein CpaB
MKQKNLILMVVAVGCGLVAAFLTTQINAKPKVEKIAVWVAAKDLPVGTIFTKADLSKLAVKKEMAKDSLPPAFIVNEEDLIDRRLGQAVLKDQTFHPGAMNKGGIITLPDGHDLITLPINVAAAGGGFVGPGSKVDVLATMRLGKQLKAFPILVDMLVVAVDSSTMVPEKGVYQSLSMVSFAATQKQALILALAKQRGSHLELLLRHQGKPFDKDYNIDKMLELMQNSDMTAKEYSTEGKKNPDESSEAPIAPEPAKIEMVKVWVATSKIPAGTEITKELIAKQLKEKEMPREYAVGAYSDLTECINQNLTLKTDLVADAWITASNVGPSTKAAPQEPFMPPKGTVTEPPKVAPRALKDITVFTASQTYVHRFEEVRPGEWKLKAILTPEEATKNPIPAATPATPPETKKP